MLGGLFRKKPRSLERQLRDLADCGVKLAPDILPDTVLKQLANEDADDNLFADWSRGAFEKEPYRLLLVALGDPDATRATNILHFDTECIEDHGDYVKIADHMRTMAGDVLPLTDVEDLVDLEANEAWLSFKLDGVERRWSCEVADDWIDPKILSQFATLLEGRRTGRRFTYLDLGGQDCILGCFAEDELKKLRKVTGLAWEWLK